MSSCRLWSAASWRLVLDCSYVVECDFCSNFQHSQHTCHHPAALQCFGPPFRDVGHRDFIEAETSSCFCVFFVCTCDGTRAGGGREIRVEAWWTCAACRRDGPGKDDSGAINRKPSCIAPFNTQSNVLQLPDALFPVFSCCECPASSRHVWPCPTLGMLVSTVCLVVDFTSVVECCCYTGQ